MSFAMAPQSSRRARVFNESPISPRKCRALLTRIVYLLHESTTLFFGTTKLFQHKDSALRQGELATTAEDVIMVTASIMKDMQPNSEVIYRPNAIRAFPSMAQGVERFFKAAIVDKNPAIASAALDVVKRWVNEAQEAVNAKSQGYFGSVSTSSSFFGGGNQSSVQTIPSSSNITQYHALGLLYLIRQQDRMAVTKMIQQLGGGKSGAGTTLKNAMALCMLIRYAAKVMEEDPNVQRQMIELLEGWLRHKSDMVNFEAARVICEMKNVTPAQLTKSIGSSPLPRTLASLALSHPTSVAACNVDLENLITDSNRSVATYAITTLLKTGNEASVDRLIKQITGFMSEISDEFKVIIVDAIRSLCLKFPAKHAAMLTFLSGVLRDEGGYDFKRAVTASLRSCLCASSTSSVSRAPNRLNPQNTFKNAPVRAAAVASMAKFGVNSTDAKLNNSIAVLLNRCLDDVDDEVRDRAALYLKVFKTQTLVEPYIKEDSVLSLAALESKLVSYVKDTTASAQPFDVSAIPKISRAQAALESARPSTLDTIGVPAAKSTSSAPPPPTAAETQSAYAEQLAGVAPFANYGPILNSSAKPLPLTESETEYQVTCVKHIFKEHIVFQFNVSNTLPDTVLEQVTMAMQTEDTGLTQDFVLPIASLSAVSSPGIAYVSFTRDEPEDYATATFQCTLQFVSKELDPSTGEPEAEGYEDEYQIEEVELSAGGDYIVPSYTAFGAEWDRLKAGPSVTETFGLGASVESLKAACDSIIEVLNMEPLGGTEVPTSSSVHTLQLSGLVTGGGGKVLVRCRMTFSQGVGVTLELGVRAEKQDVCQLVVSAVGG
ncbi:coatomer subunit gamma [Mycena olivaceomarginata]|nr:coatomer subunit gamma [Mycena olivaceomarginata]